MSILNVEHLTHGFGDRAIFNDVSFRLLKGEHIGLVGANGEGKSTFFNIVTGKLMPDEGKIEWAKNVRVGYLDQHTVLTPGMTIRQVLASAFDFLYDMEAQMNEICDKMGDATSEELEQYMEDLGTIQDLLTMHDFYMIDAKVEEVARALGLMDIGLDRDVTELSGGQRTKVLLGKLLLEKPDILLLDEPTNYLDAEHIEWLKRYLNEYENAFILISHDIPFLNSVINLIYHMDNQELTRYVGDYDKFQEVYAMKKSQLEAAYNKQQKEIADLKDFVARNKARVATRNMAMSRQKKLDKMDVIELQAEKPKPEFNFKEARTPGRYIFQTSDLVIGYDEPLSSPLNLSMERGSKIVITGANGIGKTTLLKSILGLIDPLSGSVEQGDYLEIGYFEQEMSQDISTTCIEEIWKEFPGYSQYEVRSALAKCGLTTKHIESLVKVLSGGEQAKVRLCKLINRPSNVLVLDEPTNHLDLLSLLWLQRYLKNYPGAILMISHDRDFMDELVESVYDIDNEELVEYRGNYSDFLKQRDMRFEQLQAAYRNQQKEIAHIQEFIDRFRSINSKAGQVQSRIKQLEKMKLIQKPVARRKVFKFNFPQPPRSTQKVIELEKICQSYGDHKVYENLDLLVERGERTVLVGPNGAGKSTLLKILAGIIPIDSGKRTPGTTTRIGYFSQARTENLLSLIHI